MEIKQVSTNKKQFLSLLLLADEQESMIDRYLDRGDLFVMYVDEATWIAVAVVTEEEEGVYELKNLAVDPAYQRKGIGRQMVDFLCRHYQQRVRAIADKRFLFIRVVVLLIRIRFPVSLRRIMIIRL